MKQLRQQQCSTSTSIHIVYTKPKKVLRQNREEEKVTEQVLCFKTLYVDKLQQKKKMWQIIICMWHTTVASGNHLEEPHTHKHK